MFDVILGWRKWETDFNGSIVTMQVRTLTVQEMMTLAPFLTFKTNEQIFKAVEAFASICEFAVKDIEGVTANGEPVTPKQLGTEAVFSPLAIGVMLHLVNLSNITPEDKKKSDVGSDTQATEDQLTDQLQESP